jgi:hypothetical protein
MSEKFKAIGNKAMSEVTGTSYPMEKYEARRVEYFKAMYDYLKHLTTLSTGSILLVATFLEKLFLQPRWKPLVGVALGGFMVSVIASVVQYTVMLYWGFPVFRSRDTNSDWMGCFSLASLFFSWAGFLVGIVALAIFSMKNIF